MDNFDDFDKNFNDDGSFDYESLGEPDELNEFEKNGVTYVERIWWREGGELKHVSIKGGGGFTAYRQSLMSSEDISPEDLNEIFKFRNTLPLNFLNALQIGASRYNNLFNKRFTRRNEPTLEEKIAQLQEDMMLAVEAQDYEGAALIRDEKVKLEKQLKERDAKSE